MKNRYDEKLLAMIQPGELTVFMLSMTIVV
jgi:hypothetical protein